MYDNSELQIDHPMRVAFREYQSTDEYENNRKWAQYSQNVDGSLWSVFIAGMEAQKKLQATPPADAALADELLRLAGAFDMSLNNAASVSMNRRAADSLRKTLMQAAAALRARAVPEGWSLAAHPDGGIVVQHRTLGGCFVTEKENQPREIPGQILFYLASDMLAASKAAEGNV